MVSNMVGYKVGWEGVGLRQLNGFKYGHVWGKERVGRIGCGCDDVETKFNGLMSRIHLQDVCNSQYMTKDRTALALYS